MPSPSNLYFQQWYYITQCCQICVTPSPLNLHFQQRPYYNTMLPDMRRAISFKFILSTMVLYNTMLPEMRHAISIKFNFNNGLLTTQCCHIRAMPFPSNQCTPVRISCHFNPFAEPVIFRLFVRYLLTHFAICCYKVAFPVTSPNCFNLTIKVSWVMKQCRLVIS